VTSDVPQGSVLAPVLLNEFISDVDSRITCTLSKVVDHTKRSGAVDTPEEQDTIQRDLDRLERWACVNLMRFTESQNHRVVGVGRHLCGSSSPTLLPKVEQGQA